LIQFLRKVTTSAESDNRYFVAQVRQIARTEGKKKLTTQMAECVSQVFCARHL